MKAVLDTNVLVAGLRSTQGVSHQLLLLENLGQRFTPLLSVPLFLEYEAVLKRSETGVPLAHQDVEIFLDMVLRHAEAVRLYYLWRPVLPDPGDDMVLELAIGGNAAAIVTFNTRDFAEGSKRFGIPILTPREFWRILQRTPT
ncbi:PIN domain-containing protein [Magnetofaba australis]|uniref:Putative twitching motility protein PilT n=1 Tax=Magnetofaba australis IT-1 TaxID=1434232 RepID=A0A1Y2K6T7_9PROT|nr:PIN domain-containing protein [Magnetofaba australis]OSM04141.1 putative twitching motility protein PilT [Magnetofaba australis IT-1]